MEGSTVWCRNSDGVLAFNDGTDLSSSGYTKLNAYVYESLDPNGAKVAFGLPGIIGTQTPQQPLHQQLHLQQVQYQVAQK